MVSITLPKINETPQRPTTCKTLTMSMLKQGLAAKKAEKAKVVKEMEVAMAGPIGASRTTDTALPSFRSFFVRPLLLFLGV